MLAVAMLAPLNVVQPLLRHAALCGGQLEGPQEVGGLLEVGAHGVDLMDQVLDADDAVLAQRLQNIPIRGTSIMKYMIKTRLQSKE